MPTVYIEHFSKPYIGRTRRPGAKRIVARHYLGVAMDVESRHIQHQNGTGARLLQVVAQVGIEFHISRTWKFETWAQARELERRLKRRKETPRLCPLCNPQALRLAK